MWNPLSWVMELAAITAIALANDGEKPPDWQYFVGIVVVVLLFINSTISFLEENNAGNDGSEDQGGPQRWTLERARRGSSGTWRRHQHRVGETLPSSDARFLQSDLESCWCLHSLLLSLLQHSAVYADWGFAHIKGIGWGWAGVIWLYGGVTFFPLDCFKFAIPYVLSGKAWDNLLENKTSFTTKEDYGREERVAQWAVAQRTLHGLQPTEVTNPFTDQNNYRELSEIAEQARKRAEVARLRELHTLKGHMESVVKLKGIDICTIQQHYTV